MSQLKCDKRISQKQNILQNNVSYKSCLILKATEHPIFNVTFK